MRLIYADRLTEDGTFVLCEDGDVTLVRARARRTDISARLDLTLPIFPLTRSEWRPTYERAVFHVRRLGAEIAEVIGVPFGPGDHEPVLLMEVPEVVLSHLFRRGEALAAQSTRETPIVRRRP